MIEETPGAPAETRERILKVALERFAARGYHATSVLEIAEHVGVTKAAVLYHFPAKVEILGALAEPMLSDLDAAVDAGAMADPAEAPWVTIEGVLDVWLTHRHLLRISLNDLALAAASPIFERFRDAMLRANVLVAGPRPDLARQVRAAQAIAMLGDPVVLLSDAPTEDLRARVLDGVRRLMGDGGGMPPRPARARRGRPSVMTRDMAETAQRLYQAGSTAAEIAAQLGVSRATVYRNLSHQADYET